MQPKGCRLDSPHERPKLGTDFRRRGFAGNRGSISSPVFWKLGPNFRRNCKPGGTVRNVGLTSRGADHACKGKGCQHHVVFISAFKIYINIFRYIYIYIHYIQHYIHFLFSAIHNPWSNATNLPGRRLTGASLFKYKISKLCVLKLSGVGINIRICGSYINFNTHTLA